MAVFQEYYTPYGEVENASAFNNDRAAFTGHIRDRATGLTYLQARYYSPLAGRMLGVDPVGFADTGDPGMTNRYSYSQNDPVNYLDPNGMRRVGAFAEAKVVAGGGFKVGAGVSFDTESSQLSIDLTFGEHLGLKGSASAGVFTEPSTLKSNGVEVSSKVGAEASIGANLGGVEASVSTDASLGVSASTSEGLTKSADFNAPSLSSGAGAFSTDTNGRTEFSFGGGAGASVGVDHTVSGTVSVEPVVDFIVEQFE